MNPLISVIIPVFNVVRFCPKCIHSILSQTFQDFELLLIDDGSTDGTWNLLQQLKSDYPALVSVQNTGEHGFGRAIVCGFDHAIGDAVIVVMADLSDDPKDVVRYCEELNKGFELQ